MTEHVGLSWHFQLTDEEIRSLNESIAQFCPYPVFGLGVNRWGWIVVHKASLTWHVWRTWWLWIQLTFRLFGMMSTIHTVQSIHSYWALESKTHFISIIFMRHKNQKTCKCLQLQYATGCAGGGIAVIVMHWRRRKRSLYHTAYDYRAAASNYFRYQVLYWFIQMINRKQLLLFY